MDHGLEPSQAAVLTRAIADWAKTQDEWWPWDDGTPDPEPTDWSQHPSMEPGWLDTRLAAIMRQQERYMVQFLRDPGNPATFQAVTHRELGHPVDETTAALAARWAQVDWTVRPPDITPWQPFVCIPAGTPLRRTPTWEPQDWTLGGLPVVISDGVPPYPGIMLVQSPWEDDPEPDSSIRPPAWGRMDRPPAPGGGRHGE